MIQKYIAIGHLTKNPEAQSFANSNKCSFAIAVNHSKDDVVFLDVECWNKVADNCHKYLEKGSCVYVEGRIKVNKWQGKDGLNRQKFYISADIVRFLPNGKKEKNQPKVENVSPKSNIQSIVDDEEMPF